LLIWRNLIDMSELDEIIVLIDLLRENSKSGTLSFWCKQGDIFIVDYIDVSFLKKDRKKVIEELKKIEKKRNFLFWANSNAGQLFYERNYEDIVNDFENQIKRPWLKSIYKIKRTHNLD